MNDKSPLINEIEEACYGERYKNDWKKPPIGYIKTGKEKINCSANRLRINSRPLPSQNDLIYEQERKRQLQSNGWRHVG